MGRPIDIKFCQGFHTFISLVLDMFSRYLIFFSIAILDYVFKWHIVGIQGDVIKLDWFKTDDIHVWWRVGIQKYLFQLLAAVEAPYFCDGSIGFVLLGT